jgi:hypothetical protein
MPLEAALGKFHYEDDILHCKVVVVERKRCDYIIIKSVIMTVAKYKGDSNEV